MRALFWTRRVQHIIALVLIFALAAPTDVWSATSPTKVNFKSANRGKRKKDEAKDFYQTLDRLLMEFQWDLRDGKALGMSDLAVRNIVSSPNVPSSFSDHLEQFVIEKVRKDPRRRVVRCEECRSRKSELRDGKMVITGPRTDLAQQAILTNELGIEHFMDISFNLQKTRMSLAMFVVRAEDGSVVWEKNYSTDDLTKRSGVSEVEQFAEYEPRISHRPFVSFMFLPTGTSYVPTLELGWRMTQRAFNRHHDLGFQFAYNLSSSLLTGAPTAVGNIYGAFNLSLLLVWGYTFIGNFEDFNKPRFGFTASVGAGMANQYITAIFRGGIEGRLGKHWAVHALGGYRPAATPIIGISTTEIKGWEFGGGASFLF